MILTPKQSNTLKSWGKLFLCTFFIWIFGWVVGPFIEQNIPTYKSIGQVVEDRNIDSAAYMYMDTVGSYDGEYYLADALKHSKRTDYGTTLPFWGGIISCFLILWLGWRYIM